MIPFIILLILLYYQYQLIGEEFTPNQPFTYFMINIFIILFLAYFLGAGLLLKKKVRFSGQFILMISLGFLSLISYFWAVNPNYVFPSLKFIFFSFMVYLFIINYTSTWQQVNQWKYFFLALSLVAVIYSIYFLGNFGTLRLKGIDTNPNFYSLFALISLPFLIYLFYETKNCIARFFYLILGISNISVIFLSLSRAGLIGLVVMFFIYVYESGFLQKMGWKHIRFMVSITLILSGIIFLLMSTTSIFSPDRYVSESFKDLSGVISDEGTSTRSHIYLVELSLLQKPSTWLYGIGYQNFGYVFMQETGFQSPMNPHNPLLKFTIETGIVGLLLILMIIYLPLKYLHKSIRLGSDKSQLRWIITLKISYIVFIVVSMSKPMIGEPIFYVLSALSFSSMQILRKNKMAENGLHP